MTNTYWALTKKHKNPYLKFKNKYYMTFQDLKELHNDTTYQALPDLDKALTSREKAEVMIDTLTPIQLLKMAESLPESLQHAPEGNELSVSDALRDYFYKKLINK